MNGLELRHLRVICAVADAGSLSKASAQLGVSQPALTAQLQRLERRIGGLLFARTGTGVVPTELGSYVVAVGRHVLSDVDGLLAGIRQRTAVSTSGVIRLGGMPGPIVPMLAGEIAERRSGVDVSIKIASPTDLVTMLADQQLDFVLLEEYPGFLTVMPDALHRRVVIAAPLFVGLAAKHRMAGKDVVTLADLAEESWIMPPLGTSNEQLAFRTACADAGFAPKIAHELSDSITTRALVVDGAAVSLANPIVREGTGVAVRPLAGQPLQLELTLVWHAGSAVADLASDVYSWLVGGYEQFVDNNALLRAWWDSR